MQKKRRTIRNKRRLLTKKIINLLNSGAIVILPTDTVYGIFCRALNKNAVKRIYKIKGRDFSKPLQIFLSDKNQIKKYCSLNDMKFRYINKYLPGPYTLIFKLNKSCPEKFSFLKNTIGIRVINNVLLNNVIKKTGPLAATSANVSGDKTPVFFEDISEKIKNKADFLLKNDRCIKGRSSTVIDLTGDRLKILRK
ncbi:MAG: threonylcarbamoyl-AMP synthase [Candidatus Goldbacteria bacterium]|nr:threonylcarbamoyl-AMP synthase [Candidatus Goldiibacteriota bacterium]